VPSLQLPALESPTEKDLTRRAFEIEYGDGIFARGEKNLVALMKVLGALPSTYEQRLNLFS
jgi:hypothetical protein